MHCSAEVATQLVDDEAIPGWMRVVKKLYKVWPYEKDAVREWNQANAQQGPHCSVCMLFRLAQVRV